ncbi:MAG TPA: DUF177 domain-containing protein [Microthrixaceae bacterium]|nr:DUF177 domain-containing protein [Microthrixaceae bacterium]
MPRRRGDQPLVNIVDLRRRMGEQRDVRRSLHLGELEIGTTRVSVDDPVDVDVVLESIPAGLSATGHVRARWTGLCRRCLESVDGVLDVEVEEVFAPEDTVGADEAYPLGHETIDLEPLAREAVLLGLPVAPLCRPECEGPAPGAFPVSIDADSADGDDQPGEEGSEAGREVERPLDPRWAGLDVLRAEFEEDPEP